MVVPCFEMICLRQRHQGEEGVQALCKEEGGAQFKTRRSVSTALGTQKRKLEKPKLWL